LPTVLFVSTKTDTEQTGEIRGAHFPLSSRSPRSLASSTILTRTPLTMASLPEGDIPGQVFPAQLLQPANGKVVTHLHHTTGFCQPALAHSPSMSIPDTSSMQDGPGKPTGGVLGQYQQNMANQLNLLYQLVSSGASKSAGTGTLPASLGLQALLRQGGGAGSMFGEVLSTPPSQSQPPAPAPFAHLKLNFADKTSFFKPCTGRESAVSTPPPLTAWAVSASQAQPHAQTHVSNAASMAHFVQFGMHHGIQVRSVNLPAM